jgi:fumarate hydratase subunit alpha
MSRIIQIKTIETALADLIEKAAFNLPASTVLEIKRSLTKEKSKQGKGILEDILQNQQLAKKNKLPLCQDTGLALIFMEIGQDVSVKGGNLNSSINKIVKKKYKELYLRKSVVSDPLKRKNTKDNTPAIIHQEIVPGSKIKLTFMPKGGGSENCCALKMLKPADGLKGVEDFVLETIKQADANPCPPIIVGVGIGGNFDKVAYLAKQALLKPLNSKNKNKDYAKLEKDFLTKINKLGIGPQGLGGTTTALAVHIKQHPCHIASLPVAVAIQCHANRITSTTI